MVNMIDYFKVMPKVIHIIRKHIVLTDGHILFMGAPMCFIDAEGILDMQLEMYKQIGPVAKRQIYNSAKAAGKRHGELAIKLKEKSLSALIKKVSRYAIISGWGEFNAVTIDEKNLDIYLEISDSIMANLYKQKKKAKKIDTDTIDWYVCGLFAGVASAALHRDMDTIETHCSINDKNSNICKFRILPKEACLELQKTKYLTRVKK